MSIPPIFPSNSTHTIGITTGAGKYLFSPHAFALRAIGLLSSRNLSTLAGAQTALSSMSFTAGGFLNLKKILAELVLGSCAFPDEVTPDGLNLISLTISQIASRDVSSTIT